MRFTHKAVFIAAMFLIASAVYSQGRDTLYFCRQYSNGEEIGLSDIFAIPPGGDSITIMVKTKGPVNEKHVSIVVDKSQSGAFTRIGTHKFDIEPGWDYIFFDGINFWSEGLYTVSLLRENGDPIAVGNVTMVLLNEKPK
jgi:hypothetical protein